jgi:CHAD domain-containing protein
VSYSAAGLAAHAWSPAHWRRLSSISRRANLGFTFKASKSALRVGHLKPRCALLELGRLPAGVLTRAAGQAWFHNHVVLRGRALARTQIRARPTGARALGKKLPVKLATKSKAGHGYDLIAKEHHPGPAKAGSNVTWATAFKTIARSCLYQLAANEAAVGRGDAEGVHQMRVGIRRLRTVISLFKDMLVGEQTEIMKSELKWLTGELGPARELDVFIKRVVQRAKNDHANGPSLNAVAEDFKNRRLEALGRAEEAVTSPRFRWLVLNAAAWIAIGRSKKIRKQGKRLAKLDAQHRHKLRIRAKKLRYAAEFFAGVFASKKSARRCDKFVAKLKALQDALGDLNDIRVHEGLAGETLQSRAGGRKCDQHRAGKAFTAGRLSGREIARFASGMKHAKRTHAIFAKAASFWP